MSSVFVVQNFFSFLSLSNEHVHCMNGCAWAVLLDAVCIQANNFYSRGQGLHHRPTYCIFISHIASSQYCAFYTRGYVIYIHITCHLYQLFIALRIFKNTAQGLVKKNHPPPPSPCSFFLGSVWIFYTSPRARAYMIQAQIYILQTFYLPIHTLPRTIVCKQRCSRSTVKGVR